MNDAANREESETQESEEQQSQLDATFDDGEEETAEEGDGAQDEEQESDDSDSADDGESDSEQEQEAAEKSVTTHIPQEVLDQHPEVKARIAHDHNRYQKTERALQKAQQELFELKKQHHQTGKPEEQPKPDTQLAYDNPEEFDRQMDAHYQSKQAIANWEAQSKTIESEESNLQQAQVQQQLQTIETQFLENANKQGYTKEQVEKTAVTMSQHMQQMQLSEQEAAQGQQLMLHLMKDPNGAKLLENFSRKPDEFKNLLSLSPWEAGARLGEISRSLKTSKHKSNAPPPDNPIGGRAPTSERGPAGATYE